MKYKHLETIAVRTQVTPTAQREHSVPLYLTSSFTFDDAEQARALFASEEEGNIYSRFTNPNCEEFIQKLCLMEGLPDGFATASGMAAVFASIVSLLEAGDHLLICRSVFGNTHKIATEILPKFNIECSFFDILEPETWESQIRPNSKMIFAETPSNPGLDLIDLEWLNQLAKKHGLLLNIDNCFATPFLQRPVEYGVDIITHSATKFIDGQGRVLGGAILGDQELIAKVREFGKRTGPALSAFNAWLLSKSLETLSVRMEKHCQNALQLAQHLENHPEIEYVKYPFLPSHPQYQLARKQMKSGGGLLCFQVKGGVERGRNFLDSLQMISHTANLGDTRTIVTHPASTTHSKLSEEEREKVSITPGMIRISAGLEHWEDIKDDIEQALERSAVLQNS